jgi:NitT/TauT family transport system ATP-binding protein
LRWSNSQVEPPHATGLIEIDKVCKTFARTRKQPPVVAVNDVSLTIEPHEFVSLVGPSGCGKSTLLKILAGLISPTSGEVRIDGESVVRPRRSVGIMFQTPELFPWRTVLKNVMLPIEVSRHDRQFHSDRARQLLAMVGLADYESALPRELSGGMQQRAALCRVLTPDPDVVLMDEPFGALDEFTRERLNLELLKTRDETNKTFVFVTHNIGEAVLLSDRIVVMPADRDRDATIVEVPLDRPRQLNDMRTSGFTDCVFEVRGLLGV